MVSKQPRHLSLLIKPASSLCNLRCRYCFYHDVAAIREHPSYGVMGPEVMGHLINRAFDAASSVTFAFQGGEPTLAGLPYFVRFAEAVNAVKPQGAAVQYAIQTNGAAITEEFARFFHDNCFLVGLSLDGPKALHDGMRRDGQGGGSWQRAMAAARLFNQTAVEYNILSVVTAETARHAGQVYRFFKDQGFRYLQFIPCLDALGAVPFSEKHSLTPDRYARFLIELFGLWADDVEAGSGVSIRFFDNLLQMAAGYPPEQCGMQGHCNGQLVVESDGSLYPCDFYCVDNWRIGNIAEMTFGEAYASPVMARFMETSVFEDAKCRICPWFRLCRGGCRRDRDNMADGVAGENRYCEALRQFFAVAAPRLPGLLRRVAGPRP